MTNQDYKTVHAQSIAIDRPPAAVFEYLTNLHNVPQWSSAVHKIVDPPAKEKLGKGVRVSGRAKVLGVETDVTAELKEFDRRNRRAVLHATFPKGGLVQTQITVEGVGKSSILHLRAEVTVPGWVLDQGVDPEYINGEMENDARSAVSNVRNALERGSEGLEALREAATSIQGPKGSA